MSYITSYQWPVVTSVLHWYWDKSKLECGPMHNVMATQPNIGGVLCENSLIPFLVRRRKLSLMPTARVPCSNAANIGERKSWTQIEFCTFRSLPHSVFLFLCRGNNPLCTLPTLLILHWCLLLSFSLFHFLYFIFFSLTASATSSFHHHVSLYRPCQWSYMAGHVVNPSTKFEDPTTICSWAMSSDISCRLPLTMRSQPLCMRRIMWPMRRGQIFPTYLKSWPRFACSVYNCYGTTKKTDGVIHQNSVWPCVKDHIALCACAKAHQSCKLPQIFCHHCSRRPRFLVKTLQILAIWQHLEQFLAIFSLRMRRNAHLWTSG